MHWTKIENSIRIQPKGEYGEWKHQISVDCNKRCVYCSIHENPWGGIDHFHIDHFRPKSKFDELKNIITNLYYSCPICNRFKSDDWQNEPDSLNKVCFPDPGDHNYSGLFRIDLKNYSLKGIYTASRYLINRLYLNRPQLIYERREYLLKLKVEALIIETNRLIDLTDDINLTKQTIQRISSLTQHLLARDKISPYKLVEIRKSN